ncbi:MAG: glycosyl hydrolase family protein [Candidatus Omnitrophota bacterium]|jgi:hypothetical protein|nr:MAG: glycosyl hydrolase family protein [Candidatus Omnitrophota bacterium]
MNYQSGILSLLFVLACLPGDALEKSESVLPLYSVALPDSSRILRFLNHDSCSIKLRENEEVLTIPIGRDPYEETSWDFQFARPFLSAGQAIVLEIEFYDEGAGMLDVVMLNDARFYGRWQGANRKASYTRLNTRRFRRAYFQFSLPNPDLWEEPHKPHLRITGLQFLKAISVHPQFTEDDWRRAKDAVPIDVEPMVRLQRPMDVVCTAGVDVLSDHSALQSSLEALHELAPLAKVVGFNAVESYVKWNLIEPELGRFDFRFYDAVVEKLQQYDLLWFPLLIVGSAYALPDWFAASEENIGFVCLEHGVGNPIQSIWSPYHKKHVVRILHAFGRHYEPMKVLQGVRLGPSGNYGESQYPAGGNWGYKGEPMHIHIGFWANDPYAHLDFRRTMETAYGRIETLNEAWDTNYESFADVKTVLPTLCYSKQRRLDMARWYTRSMSDWCEWWALEARKAMPDTPIYQSAGGWGFLDAGTDYVDQTKSMVKIKGGIRLTNEIDSFQENVYATRLAATAAKLYGVDLGYEPASSHTARGAVGRLFNTITTNGDHLFTYHSNVLSRQLAIDKWLAHYPLLDLRQDSVIDVAVYYPETMNQLDEGTFRHLYAWGFNPRAAEVRRHVDVDYLNETLMRDGFLCRYKVLIFIWGNIIDQDVLQIIDDWIRNGGVAVYPSFPRGNLETIEGDASIFRKWSSGDTGQGRFHRFAGDMEPPSLYGDYVNSILLDLPNLHPLTQKALRIEHPDKVFFSVLQDGQILALNYGDETAIVQMEDGRWYAVEPYSFIRFLE